MHSAGLSSLGIDQYNNATGGGRPGGGVLAGALTPTLCEGRSRNPHPGSEESRAQPAHLGLLGRVNRWCGCRLRRRVLHRVKSAPLDDAGETTSYPLRAITCLHLLNAGTRSRGAAISLPSGEPTDEAGLA